jgi:hypothetical protein
LHRLVIKHQTNAMQLISCSIKMKHESHENQEISILTIDKDRTRSKILLEIKERLPDRTEEQERWKTQKGTTKTKNDTAGSKNKSDSLSLVPGPSTITCMIVNLTITTYPLTSSDPTEGKGQCNH